MLHLPLGTRHCCGVLEIYPANDHWTEIHGFGNMARRFGYHYDRMQLSNKKVAVDRPSIIPLDTLLEYTSRIIKNIETQSSCILPNVMRPFSP